MDLRYDNSPILRETKFFVPDDVLFEPNVYGLESATYGLETATYGVANPDQDYTYRFEKRPRKRNASSVKITMRDVETTGATGQGFEINLLKMRIGMRPTNINLSANRRF